MGIKDRLNRLEDRYGDRACPTCGKTEDEVIVRTSWDGESESEEDQERCPTCSSEPIKVVLAWD